MKKLFSIVLAVVMVLSVASMALAGAWDAGAATDATKFNERYKLEVVKLALETGAYATARFVDSPNASAVNGADVYFAIRLTVTGSDVNDKDDVQKNAKVDLGFTALGSLEGGTIAVDDLKNGVYYYVPGDKGKLGTFELITAATSAGIAARCLDTATAKVTAKVYSNRPLDEVFEVGDYYVCATNGQVGFFKDKSDAEKFSKDTDVLGGTYTVFNVKSNGKVTGVKAASDGQFTTGLYDYLGIGYQDVENGKIYMSKDNLRAFLGFGYKQETSITWSANSTPIILDPNVTIPKTGDNASVIGFAMIMVAVVAAAVAVKKVKA